MSAESLRQTRMLKFVNLSTPRPSGRALPSTRAQAEGLEVHPEPRLSTPPSRVGLGAAARVKPQREWKWEIAVYLYLAGMGAGAFIIGISLHWLGLNLNPSTAFVFLGHPIDFSRSVFLWGPILVAVGAPFLILDLGIKRRFMYACLNPRTSWVARGFLILSAFIVFGSMMFVRSLLPMEWLGDRAGLWILVEVFSVILAFATAIYTGILLMSVKYIPVWNTLLLPVLFLVSALSTGSMLIILSTLGYGLLFAQGESLYPLVHRLIAVEQVLILIEAAVLIVYLLTRYRMRDQGETSVRLLLAGELKLLFWGGIVLIGFFFPVVLEYLYSHFPESPVLLFATGLFLLAGGFFLRLGVLASGVKEQLPMQKLAEMKLQF
jgi:polysulfide reductase chain C